MKTTQIEVFNLLQKAFTKDEAEKIVTYIGEQNTESMNDLKKIFLTKDDKIDILNKLDMHFKWLLGILLTAIGIAIAIIKM